MMFKIILFSTFILFKLGLRIMSFNKQFDNRLREMDFSYLITNKHGDIARLFTCTDGKLSCHPYCGEFKNFTVVWNGWGSTDTLRKKLHLNLFTLLHTGMIVVKGDLSFLILLLTIIGEMKNTLLRTKKARITPAGF
jgi:hypothetical protein